MLKGSQSRVDQRRKDLHKKLGIIAAVAIPILAVGAFFAVQSFAASGGTPPKPGTGTGDCNSLLSSCFGAGWKWYAADSDSIYISNAAAPNSSNSGYVTDCKTQGGGYWRYSWIANPAGGGDGVTQIGLIPLGKQPIASWDSNYYSMRLPGGKMGYTGYPDDDPLERPYPSLPNGAFGSWQQVYEDFVKMDAAGWNSGGFSWSVGSELSWFCAPASWGTAITPDSLVNGQHKGKNDTVKIGIGQTATFTHQLTRDNTSDPGTGQYKIVETKYADQKGNLPASSSMGSQGDSLTLTDASFSGTNSNISSGYATISFTIPADATKGSIWCQHIEYWAPNDNNGHKSSSDWGYPTWDGSNVTRGEVCVEAVMPSITPDSFINTQHKGKSDAVEAERGDTVTFTHQLTRDNTLDPGTGQYKIVETKYAANDGNLPSSSSMGSQGSTAPLTAGSFNGTNSNILSNYATISFKIPDDAVNGSTWCQHIEYWAPNDGNLHRSTSNWGYPTWDGSNVTRGEVCVTAVVPVHTPDSFVNNERGPAYVRPGDYFEFQHYVDVDRPELKDGLGIYEVNETVTNGGLSECIWDSLNNGSILSDTNFLGTSYTDETGTHNSNLDSDHSNVGCYAHVEDPEGATYCENINFWAGIDGNIPEPFQSNRNWGRSEYVCAVVRIPDLKVVKTASKTDLELEEEFTYTITVTNTDELIDTKGLIRVTDDAPEGILFTDVESDEMTCDLDTDLNSIVCDTTDVLDPQEANSFTITISAQVIGIEGEEDKTEFDNRAYVGGGGDTKCVVDNDVLECSDNAIVRIPPLPPATGVVLGSNSDSANESNLIVIAGIVLAFSGIAVVGFQATKRIRRS